MTNQFIIQTLENKTEAELCITNHGIQRKAQRGIKESWMVLVFGYGKVIHRQGLRFYFLTGKQLKYFSPKLQERLKNLVVVVAQDSNVVITAYKNSKAPKNIRHKSKRLIKN